MLYAAVQEVEAGSGIPELPQLVRRMRQQRKHMLQEKLHLKFCHEALVRHVEQVLQRHGVPPPGKPVASMSVSQKSHLPQDSQDLVLGGDVPISSIQATIAKLSIRPLGGLDSPAASLPSLVEPPGLPPASLPEPTPAPPSSPPPSSPLPEPPSQRRSHQCLKPQLRASLVIPGAVGLSDSRSIFPGQLFAGKAADEQAELSAGSQRAGSQGCPTYG